MRLQPVTITHEAWLRRKLGLIASLRQNVHSVDGWTVNSKAIDEAKNAWADLREEYFEIYDRDLDTDLRELVSDLQVVIEEVSN